MSSRTGSRSESNQSCLGFESNLICSGRTIIVSKAVMTFVVALPVR